MVVWGHVWPACHGSGQWLATWLASVTWFTTLTCLIRGQAAGATVPGSYLLPDSDVSLPDEDTGVVDGLGQPQLEHLQ